MIVEIENQKEELLQRYRANPPHIHIAKFFKNKTNQGIEPRKCGEAVDFLISEFDIAIIS